MFASRPSNYALIFVVLTFVLTFVFTVSGSVFADLAQLLPATVALVLCIILPEHVKQFRQLRLYRFGGFRWYLWAFVFPTLALLAAYFVAAGFGLLVFDSPADTFIRFLFVPLVTLFQATLYFALGEEIGWRGFLWSNLNKIYTARQASVITAAIWVVWHYIFIIWGGYYESGSLWLNTLLFSLTVFPMGIALGWLRYRSQSLWPVAIAHGISNALWQMLDIDTRPLNSSWIYVTGEAGIVNAIIWAGIALYCWRRFEIGKITTVQSENTSVSS